MRAEAVQATITFLKTRDLEETTRFYTQLMGFSLALDQGTCRIFNIRPGAYLGFCQTEEATGSPEVILTLVVEDVDGICAALEQAGAPVEVQPRLNPRFQIYQCFIRDPNGYLIEIQRFLDPNWQVTSPARASGSPGVSDSGLGDAWIGDLPGEG